MTFAEDVCHPKQQPSRVALFASTNYKTCVSIRIRSLKLQTVKGRISTGTGPNLKKQVLFTPALNISFHAPRLSNALNHELATN